MPFDVGAAVGKLKLDRSDWQQGIKEAKEGLAEFDKKVIHSQDIMKGFKKAGQIFLGVSAAVAAVGAASLKTAGNFEQYEASFTTMLGSAEKASSFLRQIQQYGAVTPFNVESLIQASKTMMAYGMSAEETMASLKMMGDVTQGDNFKLQSMARNFAQISALGRLTGIDLREMVNQGFNPLQIISEKTGESMASLQDKMSKGAISADMVAEAFKIATSEGGRFFGAMEKQSQTLNGLISTLGDSAQMLAKDFGDAILPAAKDAVVAVTAFMDELRGNDELFATIGEALKSIMDVLLEVLPVAFDLIDALSPIIETIMEIAVTLIKNLRPAFDQIVRIINILAPIIDKLFQAIEPLIEIIASVLADALSIVADILEDISPILSVLIDILKIVFEVLKPICELLMDILKPVLELLLAPIRELGKALGALLDQIDNYWNSAQNLARANWEMIKSLEKEKAAFEKNEEALKSGNMKVSERLKLEEELNKKFPELRGKLDLVNRSYEDNKRIIDDTIKKRKEDQIQLLKNAKNELEQNQKRLESYKAVFTGIGQLLDPFGLIRKEIDKSINTIVKKIPEIGDALATAEAELADYGKAGTEAAKEIVKGNEKVKTTIAEIIDYQKEAKKLVRESQLEYSKNQKEALAAALAYTVDINKAETQKLKEEYDKRAAILTAATAAKLADLEIAVETRSGLEDKEFDEYQNLLRAKSKLDDDYAKRKAELDKAMAEAWIGKFNEALQKIQGMYEALVGNTMNAVNKIGSLYQMGLDNQLTELQNTYGKMQKETQERFDAENKTAKTAYSKDLESLEYKYANHLISTAQYNREKAILEKNYNTGEKTRQEEQAAEMLRIQKEQAAAEKELKRQAFEADKLLKIASVWTNLGLAIMSVWTQCWALGPIAGPIFAGIMTGVLGGIAIAETILIGGQKFPEYKRGGVGEGFAVVGEEGPELVHLSHPSRIYPAGETANIMRNARQREMNLHFYGDINNQADLDRIMAQAAARLAATVRGS